MHFARADSSTQGPDCLAELLVIAPINVVPSPEEAPHDVFASGVLDLESGGSLYLAYALLKDHLAETPPNVVGDAGILTALEVVVSALTPRVILVRRILNGLNLLLIGHFLDVGVVARLVNDFCGLTHKIHMVFRFLGLEHLSLL